MSDQVHYKTACSSCNGRIEFPAAAAGATIRCPHCGASTVLAAPGGAPPPPAPAPAAAPSLKANCQHCSGTIAYPAASEGATVNCPHCSKPTKLSQGAAVQDGIEAALGEIAAKEKKKPRKPYDPTAPSQGDGKGKTVAIVGVVLLLIGLGVAGALMLKKGTKKEEGPKKPEKDLEVLEYHIQKAKEGGLVYVIGSVTNHSEQQYFRLNIEFELSDKESKPLGSTTDYVGNLAPHKLWEFKAIVLEATAANAKLVKLEGEPENGPAPGQADQPPPAEDKAGKDEPKQ